MKTKTKRTTLWLCLTAMLMAMNIILSSAVFSIPVPGGHFYLNDIIICFAAILLDPFSAMAVGGIGSFLGDLFFYPTPMVVSLIVRAMQAAVVSLCSRYLFKKHPALASGIGVFFGAVIMVVGYSIGRAFIYSTPAEALLKLPYQVLQAVMGAVVAMVLAYPCGLRKLFMRQYGKALPQRIDKNKNNWNRTVKKIWNIFTTVLIILVALITVFLVGVRLIGWEAFSIISGSMTPTYPVGTLVYVRHVPFEDIHEGDTITFVANEELAVVTHRVVEIDAENQQFKTKGDANKDPDNGMVLYQNVRGKVTFSIPYLGFVSNWVTTPAGIVITVVVGAVLILLSFLPDIIKLARKAKQ